jgi:hypothetical protein
LSLDLKSKLILPGRPTSHVDGRGNIRDVASQQPFYYAEVSDWFAPTGMAAIRMMCGHNVMSSDILHDLNTGRFTLLKSGLYYVNCQWWMRNEGGNVGSMRVDLRYPAGVTAAIPTGEDGYGYSHYFGTGTDRNPNAFTWIEPFAGGDSFDFVVTARATTNFHVGTRTAGITHSSFVTIVKIGEKDDD